MYPPFSAYLSIYNDWEILPAMLQSIRPYVDELVVVDGAYAWMAEYLEALGQDPGRSDERVYRALRSSGVPFRVTSRVWANELEKRAAGFNECKHQYVLRVDADEVIFFDERVIDDVLSRRSAVAEMESPTFVTPDWIAIRRNDANIGRHGFLFDRAQVKPGVHLNYLWLVLEGEQRPLEGERPFAVHPLPMAFNAHLTGWRTPETSISRAAFYTMNWMRSHGVPMFSDLRGRPANGFRELFSRISPSVFLNHLRHSSIAVGATLDPERDALIPSPLQGDKRKIIAPIYTRFLHSIAEQTLQDASRLQFVLAGTLNYIDITVLSVRRMIVRDGQVELRFSAVLAAAKARLLRVSNGGGVIDAQNLAVETAGQHMLIRLSMINQAAYLRETLEFIFWTTDDEVVHCFQIVV